MLTGSAAAGFARLTNSTRISGMLSTGAWGSIDQALVSATNFLTMVLVARSVGASAFGAFTLVYTVLLFFNSMQSALVTQPHNVLGATRWGEDYVRYTTTTAASQVALLCVATLLALVAVVLARAEGWVVTPLLYAMPLSIIAWQLQEFGRRVLYTEGRLAAAVANDVISYAGQSLVVLSLWRLGSLTGVSALWALAITSALAATWGAWQIRSSLGRSIDLAVIRENWRYGKWLAGSEIVGDWLSGQFYLYLAAAILGVASAGVLKAAVVLIGPLRILITPLQRVLPTSFARVMASGGVVALRRRSAKVFLITTPALVCYCLLVAVCAAPLLRLLYGATYADQAHVLTLYAAYSCLAYLPTVATAVLRARRITRQIFLSNVYASLVALTCGWLVIHRFGVEGAVLGMIASASCGGYLLWRAYYDALYRQPSGQARGMPQ